MWRQNPNKTVTLPSRFKRKRSRDHSPPASFRRDVQNYLRKEQQHQNSLKKKNTELRSLYVNLHRFKNKIMEELHTLNSTEITKEDAKFFNQIYNDVRFNKHPNIVKRLKRIKEKTKEIENFEKPHLKRQALLLGNIHLQFFSNPHLPFQNLPTNMLPKIELVSNDQSFHLGPWTGLHTRTIELKNDRARSRNAIQRMLKYRQPDTSSALPYGTPDEKSLTYFRNQTGKLSQISGASGKPRKIKNKNTAKYNLAKKEYKRPFTPPNQTIKLYHTIATANTNLNTTLKDLQPRDIGIFDDQSYWHTDPFFQWPGVGQRIQSRNTSNPKVQALFTLTLPIEEYKNKWIRTTNRYNRDATGTGTTLIAPPFAFRVDSVTRKNQNHSWAPEFAISYLPPRT